MRIGGKEIENINTHDLYNLHDEEETGDFNIREYVTKLLKTTSVLNNCITHEGQTQSSEVTTEQDKEVTNIYENCTASEPQNCDEFEIETNSIDSSKQENEKKSKHPALKNSKYFVNKKYQLYKTEICRSHSEVGYCKYGNKCQFAHNLSELRDVIRHPRYKTETCRTFWEEGSCPYGKRCCFIHVPKTTVNVLNESETPDIIFESTTIVDRAQGFDISCNSEKSVESNLTSLNNLFAKKNKNKMIEFKDMDDLKIDLSEINISDFEIDYDEPKKERILIDKYEVDELYVDSLFVQDQKPFWSTNEANLWNKSSLFYIKGINRFQR